MRPLSPPCAPVVTAALCVASYTLLLAACVVDAQLTVQAEAPQPAASSADDYYTKIWTVRAANDNDGLNAGLLALSINTLGTVFASYDPAAADGLSEAADLLRAIVRVTGDDQWSVEYLTVSITSYDGGDDGRQQVMLDSGRHDITVEVILILPAQVYSLSVFGVGAVVVGDRVLAASSSIPGGGVSSDSTEVQINNSGSGEVFVSTTERLQITSAAFSIAGSGKLQVEALEFHFETLTVKNLGASSDIKLLSNSPSSSSMITSATFTTMASGGVCWDVPNFRVENLEVSVGGSGSIKATGTGSCDTENVRVSGSGDARLGSMSCQRAQVSIVGSGDALVQALQYLGGFVRGSGSVKYTGQQPLAMSDKNGQLGTSNPSQIFKAIAKPTMQSLGLKCTKTPVPTLKTQKKRSNWVPRQPSSDYPRDPRQDATHQTDYDHSVTRSADVGADSGSMPTCPVCSQVWDTIKANTVVTIPVGAFIALWIVILLLSRRERRRRQRRRDRRQRDPEQQYLLDHNQEEQEDQPVYV